MSRTRISITDRGQSLVRVTCSDEQVSIETKLAGDVAAQAIADAMLELARASGQDAHARAELEELRDRGAPAIDYAKAIAGMCSDMFAAFGLPDIDVDLEDWQVPVSATACGE